VTAHDALVETWRVAITLAQALHHPGILAAAGFLFRRDRRKVPPAAGEPPPQQTEKRTSAMSGITTKAADDTASDYLASIAKFAGSAFDFLASGAAALGNDWTQIKASPAYQTLKPMIVSAVTAELGAPAAGSLVNLDKAAEAALDGLAATHPSISTP
jgi:hypothetical protein